MSARARLNAAESRVCAAIEARRDALLADLRLHVGIPTGMGYSAGLDETRDRLCARLMALGATREDVPGDPRPGWLDWAAFGEGVDRAAQPPPPTVVCRSAAVRAAQNGAGAPVGKRILISGHLDTVHEPPPRGRFLELSVAPGGATATGPGCVDMKGGLVIAVAALEALAECGLAVPWSFIMNSDEETGSYCSDRALRAEAARHDYGLALEPAMNGGGLAVSRGGSGQFMLECRGKAAHVGRDFASGVSAVDALARAIVRAHQLSEPARGTCVNVGPLSGGIAPNVVADLAAAWGNVRFAGVPEGEALELALQELKDEPRAPPGAPGTPPRAEVRVRTSFNRPAKPLTPRVQALAEQARKAAEDLGQALPFGSTAGVCDGNNLQAAGLPTIDTLGVRGGGLHTPQEWIELPSLVERCQLLAVLMLRLGT